MIRRLVRFDRFEALDVFGLLVGPAFGLVFIALLNDCRRASAEDGQAESTKVVTADGQTISTVLERFEPLSTDEAISAFEVAPGYKIELVAAEPLVIDPVAFCFDPAGRMIVVEMRGYSEREDDFAGRIRRLTDRDGDGVMDHAETLAEGLSWPTAVESFPGGVLVGVPPNIVFYPVEDDDEGMAKVGQAEIWFSGFSRSNVQGLMNSFRWGPDLRLHGASSSNGGEITGITLSEPVRLGMQDFSIDPRDRSFRVVEGGAQHGMDFDRWGNKYLTSNSDHLQQALMFRPVAGRGTRYSSVPAMRRSIAQDGPAADVYRSSPIEPWRLLRTHLRVSGKDPGIVEGGGRAAGYFTGATGVHLYEGDQWAIGEEEAIAVVCDVGGNLVHRKRLDSDGLWKVGRRIDQGTEFVRSSDTWFRPVQLGGGPDGAFYIADMYREVIEHPKSLPPMIKSQVDLNSGNDRGRIWRVVAGGKPIRRSTERLDRMPTEELVKLLSHRNLWHRRTAARLLVRRDGVGVADAVREIAVTAGTAEGRLEALAVLERVSDGIDAATLSSALGDSHAEVRRRAVEIATGQRVALADDPLRRLAEDESISVRFRLAYAMPVLAKDRKTGAKLLAEMASRDLGDPWIRWAVEGSIGDNLYEFFESIGPLLATMPEAERMAWGKTLGGQIASGGDVRGIAKLVDYLEAELSSPDAKPILLPAMADEVANVDPSGAAAPLAGWASERLLPGLLAMAEDRDAGLANAGDRMKWVRWAAPAEARRLLDSLLYPGYPSSVQQTALASLVGNDAQTVRVVIERMVGMTPATAELALTTLAGRVEGQLAIARAIEEGRITAEHLPAEVSRMLAESRDEGVRDVMASHLAKTVSPPSGELYQRYAQSLHGTADLVQGEALFKRVCGTCHAPEAGRERVGPDLLTVVDQPKEQILLSILEPNREVNPKYARVQIVTLSGQVLSGVVSAESDATVTLLDSQGKSYAIARGDIEDLQTSTQSLMPEELYKEISPEQMRDLIDYVIQRRGSVAASPGANEK